MRRVLMIAFHYPPLRGSSGIQRTLSFSRHLAEYGWEPLILTANPTAYPETGDDQISWIPQGMPVKRAFARDTARHLSIRGKYPRFLALPDRWLTWAAGAIPAGLGLIRRHRPAALWSTQPIRTAHLIGLALRRISGLPWIADFRDSMTEDNYPPDPLEWRVCRALEARTVRACTNTVFTAPGAITMYRERYPRVPAERWRLIRNGFDEEAFVGIPAPVRPCSGPLELVHSGVLYPSERDPRVFFRALGSLKREGRISPETLRIVLRATRNDDLFRPMLAEQGIQDIVVLERPLSYQEAIAEMARADGLLIFQASNCNHQVPAKLYEYFRAARPILALTDPDGDTAATLREAGGGAFARLDSEDEIRRVLPEFLDGLRAGTQQGIASETARRYSRRSQTKELADLLDEVAG